jgi:ABC-type transport system involved in multi-copper enzyme maturation permease subunit
MPIFDQGYQHWQGPLSGHGWRWLAIARHGVRVQLKNRLLRFLVLLAWVPALALVVFVAVWGLVEQHNPTVLGLVQRLLPREVLQDPAAHRATVWTLAYSYFFKVEMFCIMLLVTIAGPGLISRDLRFNALPLYFARPLTRLDYFAGKLGVIGALVATAAVGPAVFAYVVGVCFSLDVGVVQDTYLVLLGSVAFGLVVTLSTGTLMLALSSLTRRSLYVGIAWAGLWLISGSVGSILAGVHGDSVRRAVYQEEINRWVQDHPPPAGVQMQGPYPIMSSFREKTPGRRAKADGRHFEFEPEHERWYQGWQQASMRAWDAAQLAQAEEGREDWRPLCSYVANLNRLADLLLDTDTAWVNFGKAIGGPPDEGRGQRGPAVRPRERRLADQMAAQFPWWWSAAVLTALLGLSTCILTRRVRSLDRLR